MKDDRQAIGEASQEPVVLHPGPPSIEDLLRHVEPAPDEETERFVAAIYADRRNAASLNDSDCR